MRVERYPLLVLDSPREPPPALDVQVRLVSPEDDLARFAAVAWLAFQAPGTAVGPLDPGALETAIARRGSDSVEFERRRLREGLTVSAVAFVDEQPVAFGSHQPVGRVSEVVGVGTLAAYRRRGIAALLTSVLVQDALSRGVDSVFLTAGGEAVARVYERVGFRHLAWGCVAE
jgi:GNAT superfamily N-acetyltransferase